MVKLGSTLESSRKDKRLANSDNIYDKKLGKMQEKINQEVSSLSPVDEEDLTRSYNDNGHSVTKFADRSYSPQSFSGKGYKILRKNIKPVSLAVTKIVVSSAPTSDGYISFIINGVESHVDVVASSDTTTDKVAEKIVAKLSETMTEYEVSKDASTISLTRKFGGEVSTPSSFSAVSTGASCSIADSTKKELRNIITPIMMNQPNTIYEIRYDFDLNGETIEMQEGCTLKFEGGVLRNGNIRGNTTFISSQKVMIFTKDIIINGTWSNHISYPCWFGAIGDGVVDDTNSLVNCITFGKSIELSPRAIYKTRNRCFILGNQSIIGNNATIVSTWDEVDDVNYIAQRCLNYKYGENFSITDLNIESNVCGIWLTGCKNFKACNLLLKCGKYAITLSGAKKDNITDCRCEHFVIENVCLYSKEGGHGDGIHINGGVSYGRISNVSGYTTDDFLAFNSLETETLSSVENISETSRNIFNLDFENINIQDVPLAIRFYGWGFNDKQYIKNISIRNSNISITGKNTNVEHQTTPCVRFSPEGGWNETSNTTKVIIDNIRFEECNFSTTNFVAPSVGIYRTYGDITFENCKFNTNYAVVRQDGDVNLNFKNCSLSVVSAYIWRKTNDTKQESWTFERCHFYEGHYIDNVSCNLVASFANADFLLNIDFCVFTSTSTEFYQSLKFDTGSIKKLKLNVRNSELSNLSFGNFYIDCTILNTSAEYLSVLNNTSGVIRSYNNRNKKGLYINVNYGGNKGTCVLQGNLVLSNILDVDKSKYNSFLSGQLQQIRTNGMSETVDLVGVLDESFKEQPSLNKGLLLLSKENGTINWWNGSSWRSAIGFPSVYKLRGSSSSRPNPTNNDEGFEYYDSTLKKKILWNGSAWVNMDGTELTAST